MPGQTSITVDTSAMAQALNSVSNHVDRTTAEVSQTNTSVQSMTAAVCAAEVAAATKVCHNVTTGFRSLISVQMAQRKIESHSEVQAKCMVLQSCKEMLDHLKDQMQGDFERITKRYTKIMHTLGENLKNRIYNLDAPAADVADHGFNGLINRVLTSGTQLVSLDQDVQSLSNMVAMARCKNDCSQSMDKLTSMVQEIRELRNNLDNAVRDVEVNSICRLSIPVIIMEYDDLNVMDYRKTDIQIGERNEQMRIRKNVEAECELRANDFCWGGGIGDKTVSDKILDIASTKGINDRTRQIIRNLVTRAKWQKLESIK